jgi:hypothetical protein
VVCIISLYAFTYQLDRRPYVCTHSLLKSVFAFITTCHSITIHKIKCVRKCFNLYAFSRRVGACRGTKPSRQACHQKPHQLQISQIFRAHNPSVNHHSAVQSKQHLHHSKSLATRQARVYLLPILPSRGSMRARSHFLNPDPPDRPGGHRRLGHSTYS